MRKDNGFVGACTESYDKQNFRDFLQERTKKYIEI